ncbi:uncharacterized protein LOC144701449 [Wolffia australiana]
MVVMEKQAVVEADTLKISSGQTPLLILSNTNYRQWAMRMEVHLEACGFWEVITDEETQRKKDHQALSIILSAVSDDAMDQLDVKKTANENCEILQVANLRVERVIQSRVHGLRRMFENLSMKKEENVAEFSLKFTKIVGELRSLGERLPEREVVGKLLRATLSRYDSLTLHLEQFGNFNTMTMEEVVGFLKVHEIRLNERESREEEQALLMQAKARTKKDDPECRKDKKKDWNEEKMNLAEEGKEDSALLMAISDEAEDVLLQGLCGESSVSDLWYLDTDESGVVRFGDSSVIGYEGKGTVKVECANGDTFKLENVLYTPTLKILVRIL